VDFILFAGEHDYVSECPNNTQDNNRPHESVLVQRGDSIHGLTVKDWRRGRNKLRNKDEETKEGNFFVKGGNER
jgi:hypothetical protein